MHSSWVGYLRRPARFLAGVLLAFLVAYLITFGVFRIAKVVLGGGPYVNALCQVGDDAKEYRRMHVRSTSPVFVLELADGALIVTDRATCIVPPAP